MQNPLLCIQDITTLFVVVDDLLKDRPRKTGRPSILSDSELLTILLWCMILLKQKKKLMTHWQYRLVTSFARSVTGYLFHYLRILLAYQFSVCFGVS